ncbi:MAG: GDP-mannose 4,6-dehydratase [Acidimicrobiia bacterium]|nr:GDP-mannose 4,6-dehydratase [Acidimicrobiia bacterium]
MIARAIVTGGAGFVGSHLVDRLVDEGSEVLVVDDLSTGRLDNLAQARTTGRVDFHQLDITAPQLIEAFDRFEPEIVFHAAAQASVKTSMDNPVLDASVNVVGTVNVLDAARQAGTQRVVFVTTGGALYGAATKLPATERTARKPESPYGVSKMVTEEYVKFFKSAFGLDYSIIAPSNIYGPRQNPHGEAGVVAIFLRTMLDRGQVVIYGDGRQTRDFVYVEDVVDALMRAAHKGSGKLFNISSGIETTVLDIYQLCATATRFRGEPGLMPERPGDMARSVLDSSRASKVLGWQPFTPLERGIKLTADWFRIS